MTRIEQTFKKLKADNKKAFISYIMAGDPDFKTSLELVMGLPDAGADIITFHPEATENMKETISLIKSLDKKVGVSLNPDTEIKTISDYLDNIDLVLIMSVFPGFGGQKFIPEVLDKIKSLKEIKDKNNYNFDIEVDGGVNFSNSKDILNAGANILVSGTTIFKENRGDIKKNIETLRLV